MPRFALTPTLALLCAGALCAADGPVDEYALEDLEDEIGVVEPVTIRGFQLEPWANLRFADDRLVLHPKLLLAGGYDSNVYQTRDDEVDDGYWLGAAALELGYEIGVDNSFNAEAEIYGKDYFSENDRDMIGGKATLGWLYEGLYWDVDAKGTYVREDDPLIETGRNLEVERYGGKADVAYGGLSTKVGVGGMGERIDYLEDGIDFDKDERDRWRYGGSLFVTREMGLESHLEARALYYRVDYDNNFDADRDYDLAESLIVTAIEQRTFDGFAQVYYNSSVEVRLPTVDEIVEQRAVSRMEAQLPGFQRTWYFMKRYNSQPPSDREVVEYLLRPVFRANPAFQAAYYLDRDREVQRYQDSDNLRLTVGGEFAPSDRLQIEGHVGAEARFFDQPYRNDEGFDDDTVFGPYADATLSWNYQEGSKLALGAKYRLEDGVDSNVSNIGTATLDWNHRLPGRFSLFARGAYTRRYDSGSPAGLKDFVSDTYDAMGGLGFRFRKGLSVRAYGNYRFFESNQPGDRYEQITGQLDVALAF